MAPSPNFSPFPRAALVLIGLAWTVPLLQPVHRFPLTAFYSEWLAFALGLAAAVPLLRRDAWRDATLPVVALAPLGLVGLLALQVALGRVPYAGQALMAALYLVWALLLIELGQWLRREVSLGGVARFLAWFLLAGGLLHAAAGFAQHYGLHDPPLDVLVARKQLPLVFGNLGQPNHYAASISFALASTAHLYARRSLPAPAAAVIGALLLVVLALSGSRTPWIYLAVLAGLALALQRARRDEESRRLLISAASLLAGFIGAQALVIQPFTLPAAGPILVSADRLFDVASGVDARLQLWGEGWRLFASAPVLGAGLGRFASAHFLHQAATGAAAAPGVFNHAHNIVVHLLAETGAAGTLVVIVPVLAWTWALRHVKLDADWWWLLALLSVIGIHSLVERPLWYAYFLGIAALLLGLGAERGIALPRAGVARGAVALLIAVGCVNLGAVIGPYRDFERLVFGAAREAATPGGAQVFAAGVMRALREPLLEPYVELALAIGAPLGTGDAREELELNTRAMRFAPVAAVAYRRALLLALAGRHEDAQAQLERALRVYPEDAAAFMVELGETARRYPGEVGPLLELATAKLAPRGVRRENR